MASPPPKHVTILGAGLTGLVTAYRLSQALPATQIVLLDKSHRAGGWVGSSRRKVSFLDREGKRVEGEVTLESGPRSIRPRGSAGAAGMLRLIRDLDLEDSIIPISTSHPAAKNRYLLDPATSKLTKLPSSLTSLFGRQPALLRGLLGSGLSEPFKPRPSSSITDESVDAFIRRRLGPSVADNLISAMVHGIYATDSRMLSVRAAFPSMWDAEKQHGSVVLGMLRGTRSRAEREREKAEWSELGELGKKREGWSLYGLQGGLGSLTSRLEAAAKSNGVDIRLGQAAEAITPTEAGLEIATPKEVFTTSHLISALAPPTLATLLPLPTLTHNTYTTVGVLNLVYPRPPSAIHPPGFGFLVPRSSASLNPEGVLGVIFDSTAIPGNDDPALEGKVTKLTMMMGGPWWSSYPDAEGRIVRPPTRASDLVQPALGYLHRVFPSLKGVEPSLAIPQIQKDCIPTYLPGHGQRLRQLHQDLTNDVVEKEPTRLQGRVSLVGNGYAGVGVNDCVLSAEAVVRGLSSGLRPTGLETWLAWE